MKRGQHDASRSTDIVTVFASADPGLTAIAESVLRSSGIPFLKRGMRDALVSTPELGDAFELCVRREDVEDALQILEGLTEPA